MGWDVMYLAYGVPLTADSCGAYNLPRPFSLWSPLHYKAELVDSHRAFRQLSSEAGDDWLSWLVLSAVADGHVRDPCAGLARTALATCHELRSFSGGA